MPNLSKRTTRQTAILIGAIAAGLVLPMVARATDYTFTGNGNGNGARWDTGGNWTPSAPINTPGETDNVFLGTGGATLDLNGGGRAANSVNFVRNGAFIITGSGSLTVNGGGITASSPNATALTYTMDVPVTLGASNVWNVNSAVGATTLSVSGVITGSSSYSLTKNGTGVLAMSNNNSYSGATVINGGTLLLTSSGNIANSSNISVGASGNFDVSAYTNYTLATNQTLSGTGNIRAVGKTVALSSTSKLMPGATDTPGNLTLNGNLNLSTGTLAIESNGSSFSVLTVSGNVALGGGLQLKASYQPALNSPITILHSTSGGISGTFASLANNAYFHPTSGFNSSDWYKISYSSSDVVVSRQAVPEPSTLGVLAVGAGALLRRRRRGA